MLDNPDPEISVKDPEGSIQVADLGLSEAAEQISEVKNDEEPDMKVGSPEVEKHEGLEVKKDEVPEVEKVYNPEIMKEDNPEVKKDAKPEFKEDTNPVEKVEKLEVKEDDNLEVKKEEKPDEKVDNYEPLIPFKKVKILNKSSTNKK